MKSTIFGVLGQRPFLFRGFEVILLVVISFPELECQFHQPPRYPPPTCPAANSDPYPDPHDCRSYYQCFAWMQIHLTCPPGGYYEPTYMACVEGPCGGWTTPASTKKPVTSTAKPTPSKPKPKPTTSTKKPISSSSPSSSSTLVKYHCKSEGHFPYPSNPSKYIVCARIRARFYFYVFTCPNGLCYLTGKRLCGSCTEF